MFASNSRYARMQVYAVAMTDGRLVTATRLPLPQPLPLAGFYRRQQGDRLDLVSARFLKDATLFWRLCDSANAPVPAALAARDHIGIPRSDAL
jgi:hypothetical protein